MQRADIDIPKMPVIPAMIKSTGFLLLRVFPK